MNNSRKLRVCFIFLISIISLISMGQAGPGGGVGSIGVILPVLILILLIPLFKAYNASKNAVKFKTLVFITTFYEWLGWLFCITIIGIPIGLVLVLSSQTVRILIHIEDNTSQAIRAIESLPISANMRNNKMRMNSEEIAETLFNEGVRLYEKSEFNEAEEKLKKARELLPSSEDIMYNLALVYLELKKYELASELINEIKGIDCKEIIDELNNNLKKS